MEKSRIEAFSDGVIAILITIMVLELKVPHGEALEALRPLIPTFLSYVLSFIYVGIYWNNHHHMFQAVEKVNGTTLWANLYLLFWLSLFPFTTGWAEENHFSSISVALYGINLFMAGLAYWLLTLNLMGIHPKDSPLNKALSSNRKEMLSMVIYAVAIGIAFLQPWVSIALYAVVALTWLIPDQRFERLLK